MARKKATVTAAPKLKQMLLSPNVTLTKPKKKKNSPHKTTSKKSVSPQKSPSIAKRRPKPQAKASAKLKISIEDKENDFDNNNMEKLSNTKEISPKNKKVTSEKPMKSSSNSKNNSPTNNNLKPNPSKMSPRKKNSATLDSPNRLDSSGSDKPISPTTSHEDHSPNRLDFNTSDILPLPDRPTSPTKSPGDTSGSLSQIMEGETGKGTGFKCKACPKWFPNRYFQRKHMLIAHEDQLYECRVCSFTSVNPEKLKSHIIKLHVSKKEKADDITRESLQGELDYLINTKVPRKVMMEDGVALGRDINSRMRYVCALCNRVYTSKYSLERHVRCHTLEKPYNCDVCSFSSSYREHMMRHITSVHLIVHSDIPKVKYWSKKKRNLNNSDSSSSSVDNDSDKTSSEGSSAGKKRRNILRERFECAVCGKRATHKTDLMDHIRTKHPNAHIESLINQDGSKVHLIVTNAKKQKPGKKLTIQCSYCSLIFHDTWKYKVHLRSHTGVKPFQCSVCELRATSKMTVRDHIHRKHTEADCAMIVLRTVGIGGNVEEIKLPVPWREFRCEVCNELSADKYSLKLHKNKEHPEVQPFSCTLCDHKQKGKADMIIHCNEAHPDKFIDDLILRNGKPLKGINVKLPTCEFCAKTFAYRSQLTIHTRLHTGLKELSCTHCDYQTNSKVIMSQHILKKHFGHKLPTKRGPKAKKRNNTKVAKPKPEIDLGVIENEIEIEVL